LYNILTEFGVPMMRVGLIKLCLDVTCNEAHIGKRLFDSFPKQNDVKQNVCYHCFSTFFRRRHFKKAQDNQEVLELNGTHQLPFHSVDNNLLDENINFINKTRKLCWMLL
jgi:hypothetical protein